MNSLFSMPFLSPPFRLTAPPEINPFAQSVPSPRFF
jgi:hypothetical protein